MRRAGLVSLGVVLVAVAGCGQQATPRAASDPSDTPTAATSSAPAAAGQPWLLRFDSYVGEDGEGRQATYLRVVPGSGSVTKVAMPAVEPMQASGQAISLLVDAGHRWALLDSRPAARDRARGVVRMRDLTGGGTLHALSVRKVSGQRGLRTDWVSFDPTVPNVLRVVSHRQVWKVDVASRQAQREGTLPQRAGWIFGGGFSAATGEPYIEDTGSFDTDPPGNGEDATTPLTRQGGTVLDPLADQEYGTTTAPCETSAGFVAADGATWAFCVQAGALQTKVLDAGATTWRDVGSASSAVVPGDADPVFALPPAA